MIFTVFCGEPSAAFEWQSELLAHSWGRARQPGELMRLVAAPPASGAHNGFENGKKPAPVHRHVRDLATMSWSPHPYTGDVYPPYQKAAALLEMLFVEPLEGTVLLVEPTSVFQSAIIDDVRPGEAKGAAWSRLPRGEGPFGLGPGFAFLESFCVDRTLDLPAVTLPILIHTSDLRKIAARWLELMSIIRAETASRTGTAFADADQVAYVIAAAEARVPHKVATLSVSVDAEASAGDSAAPLVDYRRPILGGDGQIVWDARTHWRGTTVNVDACPPGPGRHVLVALAEIAHLRAQGIDALKPRRENGVREGKILGTLFLEIPGRPDTISLNASGASIWEVCDGNRSLTEINQQLEQRFDMPSGSLKSDIEVVIKRLEGIGALRLESP